MLGPCPMSDGLSRRLLRRAAPLVILFSVAHSALAAAALAPAAEPGAATTSVAHLLLSEVMTGGTSASDEFIEVYNPTEAALPLEGLELIYVTASGATVTRKAAWTAGAEPIPSGGHVLVANEAGIFAVQADLTYANGLSATGGSVALRIAGGDEAIDAVGWGTAASAWLEGQPAAAPAAGHSLERLPGGSAGSGQDTDDNASDFVERESPDPQGSLSPPIPPSTSTPAPSASATPTPTIAPTPTMTATPVPTPAETATPSPSPTPAPDVISIGTARGLPDGSQVTVEGVTLTDSAFTDGGGYIADESGGIAVLLADGHFSRGWLVRVTGEIDDRYAQRTIRADAAALTPLGPRDEQPAPIVATGAIGEAEEGEALTASGTVLGAASQLSSGVAFDLDDGSGPIRLIVHSVTGIDTAAWGAGTRLTVTGVIGQRDSSGSGTSGYRIQPRDGADIGSVEPPLTPGPSASASASPSPTPTPGQPLVTIAEARLAPTSSRLRVAGVVTLPSSVLGDGTAAIQDASGAIVLRLGDEAGDLQLGELVEIEGVRSTKSGMETMRVSVPPLRRGPGAQPGAAPRATGELGEADEAKLVRIVGEVASAPRRTTAENVYFDVDDGSGPIRVSVSPRTGITTAGLTIGSRVALTGVLGQETSGQQPLRGYRLWPRTAADLLVTQAQPAAGGETTISGWSEDHLESLPGDGSRPAMEDGPVAQLTTPALAAAVLAPASQRQAAPSASPELPPPGTDGPAVEPAMALALAGAALAALAALSALRAGIWRRLVEAFRAPSPEVPVEPDAAPQPTMLVPLTVVEEPVKAPGERAHAPAQHSVGRILPPT